MKKIVMMLMICLMSVFSFQCVITTSGDDDADRSGSCALPCWMWLYNAGRSSTSSDQTTLWMFLCVTCDPDEDTND